MIAASVASFVFQSFLFVLAASLLCAGEGSETVKEYGVDCSFPTTSLDGDGCSPAFPLQNGDRDKYISRYCNDIKGCIDRYGSVCRRKEKERLNMNARQPPLMQNYTSAGYAKMAIPKRIYEMLRTHYLSSFDQEYKEVFPEGDTYVNYWECPTYMIQIPKDSLSPGVPSLELETMQTLKPILEAWSGVTLLPASFYGVRVYYRGARLAPHVDRLPLVISAILNIDQYKMDEPWPLEVIGHDGIAENVTLEPGEMILYESHSIIHGRPFPLKGDYYSNVFLHFEPLGHTLRHVERMGPNKADPKTLYDAAFNRQDSPEPASRKSTTWSSLPRYIEEGSKIAKLWRQAYIFKPLGSPSKKEKTRSEKERNTGKSDVTPHTAAAVGNLKRLKQFFDDDPTSIHKRDNNGWKPIHEAARSGHKKVLAFLVENGADVNERTNNGRGGNPLWWARQMFDDNHPAVKYLLQQGAIDKGPQKK